MKVAVVGATGMVGQVMLRVLEERGLPITELIPVASERSVGNKVKFKDKEFTIVSMDDAIAVKPEIAIFSAGGDTSLEFAPKFAEVGTVVIDNSSAWRMDPTKKLVVPEINANVLTKEDKIIANPNCSTIQLVMVLHPLNIKYDIKRVVVSTYQSVTGTGKAAVDQLNAEIKGESPEKVYPYQIFKNALPHCDVFSDDDYTKEEIKLMKEPKKIMGDDTFNLTATAVRVPVQGGHSESVNIEFENEFDLEEVRKILSETPGVTLQDDVKNNHYPMPLYSEGKDDVFVGRIRRDLSQPKTLNLWIVADNLRKGAATNAVQIAEYLVANNLV
ncbi:aspartate-semialdehyde dehydrogenase [Epilithonimonas ginsengisoli]|uniref:Aspartate-semialdehyde dehydrogenase n=2 Tax=Epilithonimonas TaxID=2782229 RepID=A0A085BMV3_9FLAO|nr:MULTISPECIES: aspartate-semialdehyde dehydrogenase [Chryseobacterium group]MBO6201634.1 aspartate-semialdehyde dehydrogenase [Chryseobacterium sp.]KFC23798.1 aspartate-semialdehyde dehydrogenase [Epilithonimonas lactis]MBV6881343.1 aspartate-semialdehyde dehydrogenase [Epilithonimonas sp. FP105]MDW8550310.1 aspartate-semialdehyde dehydrogenase [Epilithonimonas ginsengisoli]OAH64989.1 aspartate-semialdehyde dehydrogenase [Chryseobacterium sp. FP211-J200]